MSQKLSKEILKEIVKECIVEVFAESFFPSQENFDFVNENKTSIKRRKKKKRPRPASAQNIRSNSKDKVVFNETKIQNEGFNNHVTNLTSNLTSDPVMVDIFKDTASTTLQNQIGAESKRGPSVLAGGDSAAMTVHNSDPLELFSESSNKWASLAFAKSIKK